MKFPSWLKLRKVELEESSCLYFILELQKKILNIWDTIAALTRITADLQKRVKALEEKAK